ncbi:glutamate synthase, partial [Luteimonas sp. C4P040a]|nr:glutamate synthase [Luteimonas fraxinea]
MDSASSPTEWVLRVERAPSIDIDGDAVDLVAGFARELRLTFSGLAGHSLGVGLSNLETSDGNWVYAVLHGPEGQHVTSTYCYPSYDGCGLNLTASETGVYSLTIAPSAHTQSMSFKTTLSTDVSGGLVRDVAQTLALSRRGQNAQLTFNATAGETLALQVAGQVTVPTDNYVYYYVYRPDGALLTSVHVHGSTTLNLPNLPQTGDYVVWVDPENGAQLETQLLLASGTSGGEEIDGAEGEYETTVPGQNTYLTFSANEGQSIGIGLSSLQTSDGNWVHAALHGPEGQHVTSAWCYPSYDGCGLNLTASETGVYSLTIAP